MYTLLILISKVIPLYLLIFLGFLAGKFLNVKKESIAPLLIYIISPLVIFNSIINTKIELNNITLPILFFILGTIICFTSFRIGNLLWQDSRKNILAFASGTGNTGYFGLPVAIALFGENISGLVMLSVLGFVLYENTVGFYITARGQFSARSAFYKVIKLPAIYAFIIGIIFSLTHVNLGETYTSFATNIKGAYTVFGMMLIGLAISGNFKFDLKFTLVAFIAKFVVWPLIVLLIILIDNNLLHFWNNSIHQVMILMSIVPLAANTVAYATELKVEPEKASLTVFFSTIFALIYIPLITIILGI